MLFGLSTVAVILLYDVSFTKDLPRWTFFYMAFANFAYQTFDAVDGLHARAIKASSPLGQLFDHGIDALLHAAMGCCQMSAMKTGANLYAFIYFHGLVVILLLILACILYRALAALLQQNQIHR
jgi:phosphatidylglycerophosphate synthase